MTSDAEYPSYYWLVTEPVHSLFLAVTSTVSLLTNVLLIYALMATKNSEIASYRYLLLCFALCDILTSIMHFVALPQIQMTSTGFWFIPRNEGEFRTDGGKIATAICFIFIATYYQTFLILSYHFVYRLKLLAGGFDSWSSASWVLLGACINVIYIGTFTGCCWNTSPPSEYSRSLDPSLLIKMYGVNTSDPNIGYLLVTWKRENLLTGELEWYTPIVVALSICTALFMGTGAVISACIILISNLFKSVKLSAKTRQMQQQLFRALLIQTGVPCLLSYLPLATILLFPITGIDLGALGTPLIMTTAIFPSIDAIFVISFIPRLRTAVTGVFQSTVKEISLSVLSQRQRISMISSHAPK